MGFKNAVETDFPLIRIWVCYFHFTTEIMKELQELGLFAFYRIDPLLNGYLRKIFTFGYLPVFGVRRKFSQNTQTINARFLKEEYKQHNKFFAIFRKTWLNLFSLNL